MTAIKTKEIYSNLAKAISFVRKEDTVGDFPKAWRLLIWQVMKIVTLLKNSQESMDKKIIALKKEMDKKLNALVKEDIPRDKKLKECAKVMPKKKKK